MSTLAYADLTTRHEEASESSPSGIRSYVDAMAALVPAEVLALHAVILSVTTATTTDADGTVNTTITAPGTLEYAFWGLIALTIALFIVPRILKRRWAPPDVIRMLIPPLAFIVWTMLQRSTAFDAFAIGLDDAPRTVIALFAAVILGLIAGALAKRAEQSDSSTSQGGGG